MTAIIEFLLIMNLFVLFILMSLKLLKEVMYVQGKINSEIEKEEKENMVGGVCGEDK